MPISSKIRHDMMQQSWVRQMFDAGLAMKRELGEDRVFDLSLGNPILEPPKEFREELRRLLGIPATGMHRYMPNAGYTETRAAIAAWLAEQTGLSFTGTDIVMSCGAGGALNILLKSILEPGDEVIILAPFFPEYPFYIDNHSGITRIAPTDGRFQPDVGALERIVGPRTKALLVNSPNNPTGVLYPSERLGALGELLKKKEAEYGTQIYLISDEPYANLLFDGVAYPRALEVHNSTVVATSYSKDLSLAGERIGYLAVHPQCPGKRDLVEALTYCTRVLGFVNAPALMQHVVRALQGFTVDIGWYQRRRDFLHRELVAMGYEVIKPEGAFYMFPRSPLPDDVTFVRRLQGHNILVVPGVGFGTPGHFRISYAVEQKTIEGALEGFRLAIRETQ